MKLFLIFSILLLATLGASQHLSLLRQKPKVYLDFSTMAYLGSGAQYKCDEGSLIDVGSKTFISLGLLGNSGLTADKLCKVTEAKLQEVGVVKISKFSYSSKDEAEIQMLLRDVPQVANVYSWANVEEYRVVFMEYVDFVDWKVWKFRIDKDVRGIWKKILQAVDAIHEKGILHLDLHLGNLLLTKDGEIKVIDFEHATYMDTVNVTSICAFKNKHPITYSSPEYVHKCKIEKVEAYWDREHPDLQEDLIAKSTGGSEIAKKLVDDYDMRYQVGPPADVWTICSALYELMYGDLPYNYLLLKDLLWSQLLDLQGLNHVDKVQKLMEQNVKFIFPPYPSDPILRDMVMRCLVKDPTDRPTIEEMLKTLELPKISNTGTRYTKPKDAYKTGGYKPGQNRPKYDL